MQPGRTRDDRLVLPVESFSSMGAAYRRNAAVDVSTAEFRHHLARWQARSGAGWAALRHLTPAFAGLARREAWVMDHRMVFLSGGRREGEPVVLLHGFGSSKENWLTFAPLIGRRYRVLAPDMPGFGESGFIRSARYGLAHQAERVARFLERCVGEPVHLVGSSMGGGIAAYVAAQHPQWVRSLTLMNAAGVPGDRPSRFEQAVVKGRNELIPRTLRETVRMASLVASRGSRLSMLAAPLLHAELAQRYYVNHRLFDELFDVETDPAQEYARIRTPTLVLWGDQDRVLNVSSADAMARVIPGATRKILQGVGHLPMIEAPFVTARTLQKFWAASITNVPTNTPALAGNH